MQHLDFLDLDLLDLDFLDLAINVCTDEGKALGAPKGAPRRQFLSQEQREQRQHQDAEAHGEREPASVKNRESKDSTRMHFGT